MLQNLWERACSRKGCNIHHHRWLTPRYREQARSHRFIGSTHHRLRCQPRLVTASFQRFTQPAVSGSLSKRGCQAS